MRLLDKEREKEHLKRHTRLARRHRRVTISLLESANVLKWTHPSQIMFSESGIAYDCVCNNVYNKVFSVCQNLIAVISSILCNRLHWWNFMDCCHGWSWWSLVNLNLGKQRGIIAIHCKSECCTPGKIGRTRYGTKSVMLYNSSTRRNCISPLEMMSLHLQADTTPTSTIEYNSSKNQYSISPWEMMSFHLQATYVQQGCSFT